MEELLKIGCKDSYKKGEILIRPTDLSDKFFVLLSGMVHVYTIEDSGELNVQIIYGAGDIFPLALILNKSFRNIYYEALSDVEVLIINADIMRDYLQSNASISLNILKQVIRQFILYKARVDNLEYKFARERIAYGLLLLGKKFGEKSGNVIVLRRIGQEELGRTTNVSRESVSRELKRFEKLRYIEYDDGKLKILNPTALRNELAASESPLFIDDL